MDISDFKGADIINVCDVTERVDELRSEKSDLQSDAEEADADGTLDEAQNAHKALEAWEEEEGSELATLEELLSDLCGYGGNHQWEGNWYPDVLILDSHFEDYAQQLAEDCGMIPPGLSWPCNCIDWVQAATQLQQDYSSVDFDGNDYWYR